MTSHAGTLPLPIVEDEKGYKLDLGNILIFVNLIFVH
jgi:hypothetical protein